MSALIKRYRSYLRNREYLATSIIATLLFAASLVVNFFAGLNAAVKESSPVTDIILSNTPVINVTWIFVYGSMMLWGFIIALCVTRPQCYPFVAKSAALFIFIRSVFVSLTHIGSFPTALVIQSNLLDLFTLGGDLFFSGHTGIPYLMALIFWDSPRLRYFFLGASVLFGAVVLLGHLHYSIDVFSAFFITYSIYRIARRIFGWDHRLFSEGYPVLKQTPQL